MDVIPYIAVFFIGLILGAVAVFYFIHHDEADAKKAADELAALEKRVRK